MKVIKQTVYALAGAMLIMVSVAGCASSSVPGGADWFFKSTGGVPPP